MDQEIKDEIKSLKTKLDKAEKQRTEFEEKKKLMESEIQRLIEEL